MARNFTRRKNTRGTATKVKLYRVPLYRRKILWQLLGCALVVSFIGLVAVVLYLKPHRDKALSFDLEDMRELEQASIIFDRHRQEIGRIYVHNRQPIPIEDMPHHLIEGLVATEDSRFFTHSGVDFMGIMRAMIRNVQSGGYSQGASTVTQQLARNSFGLRGKNIDRKLTEAFLAYRIEQHYSKSEILEFYLNRIYFGSGFYGVEAASRGYFGKSANTLTIDESALICGLIKSPNKYSPLNNAELSKGERNHVLRRMRAERMISGREYDRLSSLPVITAPDSSRPTSSSYEYEQVRQRVNELIGFERASVGGYRIYTTIDRGIQRVAQDSLRAQLSAVEKVVPGYEHQTFEMYDRDYEIASKKKGDEAMKKAVERLGPPKYLQGAVLMIDNETGGIISVVGGRDHDHNEYNRALQARRPVGTAFKPLVYAAAFEQEVFPASQLSDSPIDNRLVMIGGTTGILGEWGGETEKSVYRQEITARQALVDGKNAATVRLGIDVGLENVKNLSKKAGIVSPLRDFPATFLGASEVTLGEMCLAYTIFPKLGMRPEGLHIISSIRGKDGGLIYQFEPEKTPPKQVLDPVVAYQVHSCLEQALTQGTGSPAKGYGLSDAPAAGKTGTHYNFTDLWFVGYNDRVTCGVWAGFDRPKTIYHGAFSNRVVLPIWVDVMNASQKAFPASTVKAPVGGRTVEICDVSGLRATDSCYEPVLGEGDGPTRYVRCTFHELIGGGEEMPGRCGVHTSDNNVKADLTQILADAPGLTGISDIETVEAVSMMAATIIGEDPFNSVQPALRARPVKLGGGVALKAKRPPVVFPTSMGSVKFRIKLRQPPPLQFE